MIASEGMTFTIKTQELTEAGKLKERHLRRWEHMTAADYEITETPYVVPNGKWVMERWVTPAGLGDISPTGSYFVGNHKELTTIELERDGLKSRNLYIGDLPFGVISWENSGETWLPTGGIHLTSAKQIHKGQLGQLVPIPALKYVREDKAEVREWARGRRRSRSHIGWGKLSDLIETTGLGFEELIERFWPFVDSRAQSWHRFPAALDVLHGVNAEQIKQRKRSILQYTKQDLVDTLNQDPNAYNDVWIREGLIKTILRLIALDYTPVGATINA